MPVDSPEDLYGLPLPHFIPERAALVKALRKDKRREEATAVAGMRKPSVAAWAVNQLVRTQGKTIRALFKAGDDLARVQSGAGSGERAADALRAATRRQRDAIDELLQAATGLLTPDGHPLTATTLERVSDTLRAASIDGASRQQVADGCLPQELRFAGLGIGDQDALLLKGPSTRTTKPKQTRTPAAKRRSAAKESQAEAEAVRKRKAALAAARQTEATARRGATRAEKELAAAQARRKEAAVALQEAEELLATASKRAKETAAELESAERTLSDLADQ